VSDPWFVARGDEITRQSVMRIEKMTSRACDLYTSFGNDSQTRKPGGRTTIHEDSGTVIQEERPARFQGMTLSVRKNENPQGATVVVENKGEGLLIAAQGGVVRPSYLNLEGRASRIELDRGGEISTRGKGIAEIIDGRRLLLELQDRYHQESPAASDGGTSTVAVQLFEKKNAFGRLWYKDSRIVFRPIAKRGEEYIESGSPTGILQGSEERIGRSSFPEETFGDLEKSISREHVLVRFLRSETHFALVHCIDLGSTMGTVLNVG